MDTGVSGEIVAPLGRYDCDPSGTLLDYMYTRFTELYDVDVLLIPGDSVAHKIAATDDSADPDGAHYEAVKLNIAATFNKLQEYFPNTVILPTFGNNDGRVHDEAIDEADKADYYSFIYDLWFVKHTANASLDLASIKETLYAAGYYRADISGEISVLSINSMYMDSEDDQTHDGEQQLMHNWFSYQLALAKTQGRKVIIIDHVYAGSRWGAEKLWHDDYNTEYFKLLRDYHEQVIIEVVGHDHYSDLRYHSSNNVAGLEDTDDSFDFHNVLVAPGVTPYDNSNPGFAKFTISDDLVPTALHMEFLNLQATLGQDSVAYAEIDWWSVDFSKMWDVTDIDATSLATFRKRLEDDEDYTLNYLVSKLGFDYTDEA